MEPKRQHTDPASPQWVSHLLDLPQELLAIILGMFMKVEGPWKSYPRTLAEVNTSINTLVGIRERAFVIRLVFHARISRVGYGARRLYVTSCMIHILRRQKMLLERHHSTNPTHALGPVLPAIYEGTFYQISFINQMVHDGITSAEPYRFMLERLKAVKPHHFFARYVGGQDTGLRNVVGA